MKVQLVCRTRARQSGYTLLLVIAFATVSLMVLGAALNWCMTSSKLNDRNNQYHTTAAAAEAATEKVIANLSRDYTQQGESLVYANLASYRLQVPTTTESSTWGSFAFNDAAGHNDRTYVERVVAATYVPLQSQYEGIYGLASTYRVVSNARMLGAPNDITAAVKQDVQLASIPIFQFAIFYTMDLEINPGPTMNVTGRVHGNANINLQPQATLTFQSHVTAAGAIIRNKHTNDPSIRNLSASQVVYQGEHDANTSSLNLPIGTNNTPDAVQAIVEIPPGSEDSNSLMGRQRFYNKSDMVIIVSNSSVIVKSGLLDGFATTVPASQWTYFMTNGSFYNKREGKTIQSTDIDIGKFKTWSGTNGNVRAALGNRDVRSLYVADMRTQTASTESGVRVKNGQTLPSLGLTLSSPNPLYVQGHYNAPATHLGTTNTSLTKPAALIGDSITVLSTAWDDADGGLSIASRVAANTTVNAALLGGIVPSNGSRYSGGVENFPRFLEDWNARTFAYNGSMVVMFYSKISTAPWGTSDVYVPPLRQWTFDLNFMDVTKLPPGTPEVRALIRAEWALVKPGTTS